MRRIRVRWSDNPPRVLSLCAVEVEPRVTPTIFASAVHAWDTLPPDLRVGVEGPSALHIAGVAQRGDHQDEVLISTFGNPPSTVTPIGHHHLRTLPHVVLDERPALEHSASG